MGFFEFHRCYSSKLKTADATNRNAKSKTDLRCRFLSFSVKIFLISFYVGCPVTMGLKIWVWEAERVVFCKENFFSIFSHFSCGDEFSIGRWIISAKLGNFVYENWILAVVLREKWKKKIFLFYLD